MAKLLDRDSLIEDPKIHAYALKRQALPRSRPVSHEQAMQQILRFSKQPRPNVYASTRINEDGALILKRSP